MLSITGRIELDNWTGFEVAGGLEEYQGDSGFSSPELKIAYARMTNGDKNDPLDYARVVHLTDDESAEANETAFQAIIPQVVHGLNPDWKLVGFRVFPDGVELCYVNKDYDYQMAIIENREFRIGIDVPVSDAVDCELESFQIDIRRCYSGEYYSTIDRSSNASRHYELWYSKSHTVTHPAPKNRFAKWIAKMLFPNYYGGKKPSCIDDKYSFGRKTFLEIYDVSPIVAPKQRQ